MMDIAIKRYSRSVFEAALEKDSLETVYGELSELKGILHGNQAFFKVLEYPMITLQEKYDFICEIFSSCFNPLVCDFMKLLIEKDRIYLLNEIIEDFEELYFNHKKIIKAQVISAAALAEELKAELAGKLEAIFSQSVIIDNKVDPSILGGLYIKARDRVIDASTRGKLEMMKENLLGDNR